MMTISGINYDNYGNSFQINSNDRENGFVYERKRLSLVEKTVLSSSEVRSALPTSTS